MWYVQAIVVVYSWCLGLVMQGADGQRAKDKLEYSG